LCEEPNEVTADLIEAAVQTLLDRESTAYILLWESFSMNQRRFLKGLANEQGRIRPFEADFIQSYDLGSPSNVQRVVQSLLERDVIDYDNGSPIIADRFFRIWLHKLGVG